MLAKQLINNSIIPLNLDDTSATGLSLMDDYRTSHIPVVNESEFLGLISEKDIYDMNDFESTMRMHISHLQNHYVYDYQHIYDVLRIASEMNLTLIPVVDEKSKYLGCITLQQLLNSFAGIISVNNPGGIIVLELSYNDYSLSEIAQIVESNDAKVISLFITSFPESTKIEVTLKLNVINMAPVIQTFNRYDYFVKASYTENTEFDYLKQRYDSLMKFLDI
jgi:CBS domain-containing protein